MKYLIMIAGLLGTTAIVSTPLTPYMLASQPNYQGTITAESVIRFGSETFYSELEKPGNEYLRKGVEGYSQELLPNAEQERRFSSAWNSGVASFKAGYNGCIEAFFSLMTIPDMQNRQEKNGVCDRFRQAKENLRAASAAFTAAKASVSPASSQGFMIGMVLHRVSTIESQVEESEISCMKAVLADRDENRDAFNENVKGIGDNIREMRRLYVELKTLNHDFEN